MSDRHADRILVFARTVYRELRRGGHGRAEMIRFLNALLDQIVNDGEPESVDTAIDAICPDTGLPNGELALRMVDYEIRRVNEGRQRSFLLVCLELHFPPDSSPADILVGHRRLTNVIRHQSRDGDALARLDARRYLLLLPNAEPSVVPVIAERATTALDGIRRRDDERGLPRGAMVDARAAACTSDVVDARDLITRCTCAEAIPFYGDGEPT